jgi:predicted dienelactone hydrolase
MKRPPRSRNRQDAALFGCGLPALLASAMLAIGGCGGGGGGGDAAADPPAPTQVVPPLPVPGPLKVACSNVAQDFSRVVPGDDIQDYWEGVPSAAGVARYATELLADPANTLTVRLVAPADTRLYGSFAGLQVTFVAVACYPTPEGNPRPDYALPTGKAVPHMQTGSAPPLFADESARYPVLVFSHGYSGSPLSNDYIAVIAALASHGYVVLAPFHGDPRFSNLRVDDFGDAVRVLSRLENFTALQALRPLALSAALDALLAHPQWRDHLDGARIGGFGASMGGESMLLLGGAGLTTSLGLSWTQVTSDPRIKAAVGYVPYFGQPFLPAFGRDGHGLDNVTLPYLAIGGTADTSAPIYMTEQGLRRVAGTRELVALNGVKHGFDVPSTGDIFTWTLTFLDAEVRGNAASRRQLAAMARVDGGGDDFVVLRYNGPPAP